MPFCIWILKEPQRLCWKTLCPLLYTIAKGIYYFLQKYISQHILFLSFLHFSDDINEPQSYVLARLCVYCIISALEARVQNSTFQKKRSRSHDGDDHDLNNAAKMRKITADGSDNSCSNDFLSENSLLLSSTVSLHSNSLRETPAQLKESLQSAMQYIFKVFQQFVTTDELSPKIYFVYQFITLLVECGKERVRPVLKLLPSSLINNLIKVMLTDDINVGLITR